MNLQRSRGGWSDEIYSPFLIAFLLLLPSMALAGSPCQNRDKIADLLDGRYSEKPIAAGLESSGRLIELFATPDRGTWTLVMTSPNGVTCVIAAGFEWQRHKPKGDGT